MLIVIDDEIKNDRRGHRYPSLYTYDITLLPIVLEFSSVYIFRNTIVKYY